MRIRGRLRVILGVAILMIVGGATVCPLRCLAPEATAVTTSCHEGGNATPVGATTVGACCLAPLAVRIASGESLLVHATAAVPEALTTTARLFPVLAPGKHPHRVGGSSPPLYLLVRVLRI